MIKRIETLDIKEKKDKRNKIIIGVVLVGLMVLSSAGYAFFNEEKTTTSSGIVKYGDYEFVYNGQAWQILIEGYNFYFQYLPNETYDIIAKKTLQNFSGKPLYINKNSLGSEEIVRNLNSFIERVQLACYNGNCSDDLPIKNCADNFIVIENMPGKLIEENNCIFISDNDTVKIADSYLYSLIGIKQ